MNDIVVSERPTEMATTEKASIAESVSVPNALGTICGAAIRFLAKKKKFGKNVISAK